MSSAMPSTAAPGAEAPTGTATPAQPSLNASPGDLTSMITMLLSFSALRDWLKLIVFGGVVETCRRLIFSLWYTIVSSFWITVEFEEGNDSFDWISVWLSEQPSWSKAREISINTHSFGLSSNAILVPGEEKNGISGSDRKLGFMPSFESSHTLWYKRHYIRITRSRRQEGAYSSLECLTFKILARNHAVLHSLLFEAKKAWNDAQEHNISIYASDSSNNWRHIASRPKRPLRSIVLDDGIKELLLEDANDFLESKSWYAERGIPFRRGYLLYGAPGSGKTSMIHSLAGELGLDVYVVSLSRAGLDDSSLQELISDLPEKCIALMEDIDAAFHHGVSRNLEENKDKKEDASGPVSAGTSGSRLSLSGLLNALDGVGAQEGRMLYATTNRYQALDAALCRPGRMDLHVEFRLASQYQARELFKCFYMPTGFMDAESEAAKKLVEDEKSSGRDSGYATPTAAEEEKLVEVESPPVETRKEVNFTGSSHKVKAPKLNAAQVEDLAQQFGDAVPEREISMASLQGYLMAYKVRPFEAIACVEKWVEDQRKIKAKDEVKEKLKEEIKDEVKEAVKEAMAEEAQTIST